MYSRINNPDLEILENRLSLWDKAEEAAAFESRVSAITTVFLELLRPGDLPFFSSPVYGGTDHFIRHFLNQMDIQAVEFTPQDTEEAIRQRIEDSGRGHKLKIGLC
ncbi:MAG: PLP-dependent transferase [Saprospiraceae bacterium]